MNKPTEQQIAQVCHKYSARFLALFGSRAKNAPSARDTDIAVSFGRSLSAREELDFFYDIVRLFATDKIDVVVLDKAPPVLLKEVALHGTPLFEREHLMFDKFIINAIAKYQDTKQNRRISAQLIDEYLRENRHGA